MPADRELKPNQRMKTKVNKPTPAHQLAMSRGQGVHCWFSHQTLATVRFHCWVRWSRVEVGVNRHLGDSLPSHFHSDSAGNPVLALSVQCWRSCFPSVAERSCNESLTTASSTTVTTTKKEEEKMMMMIIKIILMRRIPSFVMEASRGWR